MCSNNSYEERVSDGTLYKIKRTKYLDLNKWYCIVVPKSENAYDEMSNYRIWDEEKGDVRDCYLFMKFHEDTFCLMEKYLFNFINTECGLLINMYEEEWIEEGNLKKTIEITDRMINNSDNDEFIELAIEFKKLVEKAIELNTCVGCYF